MIRRLETRLCAWLTRTEKALFTNKAKACITLEVDLRARGGSDAG